MSHSTHKHKEQPISDHSSDEDFEGDEEELNIEEEIINKIKVLPTLKEKVHCIAVNHYLEQKRKLDEGLQKEIEEIEQKFRTQFNPFINQINSIVSGEHNFTEADFEGSFEILTGEELAVKENYTSKKEKIPEYWLKAFITSGAVGEHVHEVDEPVLKHLQKVEAQKTEDLKKFSVYFYFSENEWFSNTKVAKHFDIDETEIKRAYGDEINWKEGKNITVKIVKKKSKKGGKKTKQVKQESFFNLFKQVDNLTDNEEENNEAESQNDEDEVEELERQYQLCESIYEEVIPKSLELFLGIVDDIGGCCGDEECDDMACVGKGVGKRGNDDEDDE